MERRRRRRRRKRNKRARDGEGGLGERRGGGEVGGQEGESEEDE